MKETFYFPHDYNAIQDPRMMSLIVNCGLGGVGMYWIIIEILHQQEDGCISQEELNDYIRFYTKFSTSDEHLLNKSEHLLNKINEVLIGTGLLILKDDKIWSSRVLKNKEYRNDISEKRSLAGKKSAELRINPTSVQQNRTSVQQNPTKERKGKERKGNNKSNVGFDFEFLWEKYPSKDGRKNAERHFNATVKTEKDYSDIKMALENYLASERVRKGYIKNGDTWFNNWMDWINYSDPVPVVNEEEEVLRKAGMINDSGTRSSGKRSYHEG